MTNRIDRTLDRILFLARRFQVSDEKYIAKIIVLELGVLPKYDGYKYLVQAISVYIEAPVLVTIKNIYSALAALYNETVDAKQIEQSIRSAIRQAWKSRDEDIWRCYFPLDVYGEIEKPSNGDFISTVACVVDLWKGWCRDYEKGIHSEEDVL